MIYILSWTTKKHQKILSRLLHSKLKKIQALFKDLHRNLRTFQGKWNSRTFQGLPLKFKDFSSLCEPCVGKRTVGETTQGRRNDRGQPYLSSCCHFKRIYDLRVVTNFTKEPFLTTKLCVG